jgi:hypothetical protein
MQKKPSMTPIATFMFLSHCGVDILTTLIVALLELTVLSESYKPLLFGALRPR